MAEQPDIDNHKLMYHPGRVTEWLRTGDCFPIYVEIGPTNSCNHRCIFCALDYLNYGKDFIDKEVMLTTLKDMANSGVKSVMFAGEGEPLLHKEIDLFVQKSKQHGLDISITTNGALFDKERAEKILQHLSWIRFSIDASSAGTYSKVHKVKEDEFYKVIENIKNAAEMKKKLRLSTVIGTQFLLISENINEVAEFAKLVKDAGADNAQIKPYSHHPLSERELSVDYSKLSWLEAKLAELNDENFKVLFRKKTMKRLEGERDYKECYGLPFFALIDAKGNVIPCNLFYNNQEFVYGSLYEKSFSEIWKSERRKQILEKLGEKGVSECRMGCRLDPSNRYLDRLKNPCPHDNFI